MDLMKIVNFLLSKIEPTERLQKLIAQTALAIDKNEKLRKLQQDYKREIKRITLELRWEEEVFSADRPKEIAERLAYGNKIGEAYKAFLMLHTQIERLDLQELFGVQTMLTKIGIEQKMKWKNTMREHEEKINRMMENRPIVQEYREKHRKVVSLRQQLQELKKSAQEAKAKEAKELKEAESEMHARIVRILVARKELERLRNEAESMGRKKQVMLQKPLVDGETERKIPKMDDNLSFQGTFLDYLATNPGWQSSSILQIQDIGGEQIPLPDLQILEIEPKILKPVKRKRVTFFMKNIIEKDKKNECDYETVSPSITPVFNNVATSTPTRSSIDKDEESVQNSTPNFVNETMSSESSDEEMLEETSGGSDITMIETAEAEATTKKNRQHEIAAAAPKEASVNESISDSSSSTSNDNDKKDGVATTVKRNKFSAIVADLMNASCTDSAKRQSLESQNTLDMFTSDNADNELSAKRINDSFFCLMDSDVGQHHTAANRSPGEDDFL